MIEHLKARQLDPSRYSGVYIDTDRVTFALWNLSGQMIGYQVYRPDKGKERNVDPREQRYFTFITRSGGKHPALAVWGIETIRPNEPIYITEGIFDACRLHNLGLAAVATLGSDPAPLKSWLRTLPQKKIALCDGDKAGFKLAKFADEAIFLPAEQDPGSMTDDELMELIA